MKNKLEYIVVIILICIAILAALAGIGFAIVRFVAIINSDIPQWLKFILIAK